MVDFATLSMGVDTSALLKGERALDGLARAGARTESSVSGAMAGIGASADQAATRVSGAATKMDGATRAATANLTFQLNDIAQMMAAGQSPFMLAMQQGGQVAGALNDLRGGVGIVRGLGIAFASLVSPINLMTMGIITFGTMAVQWLTASRTETISLDDALGNLKGSLGEIRDVTALLSQTDLTDLREQFGGLSQDVLHLLELQRELALMDAMQNITSVMDAAMASMDGYLTTALDGIRSSFDTTYDNARRIQMLMQQVQAASTPTEALNAVVALRRHIESTIGPLTSLEGAAHEMAVGLVQSEYTLRQVVVEAERSETALVNAAAGANGLSMSVSGLQSLLANAANAASGLASELLRAARALPGVGGAIGALVDSTSSLASRIGGALKGAVSAASGYLKTFAARMTEVKTSAGGGGAGGGGAASAIDEAAEAAKRLREEMQRPLISAIDGVANAFGDFVAGGLSDFKGFVQSIIGSFKQMLSQMIAMAARNRIMIGLGLAPAGLGGAAMAGVPGMAGGTGFLGLGGLGAGGGLLGSFGSAGSIFGFGGLGGGTGLLGGLGNALSGGLGGIFNIGANAAAAGGGLLASIGAAIPVLGAVGLVFGLFRKKVEQLDNGLRITIDGMDALVETFSTTKTTRFFGLSKKVRTTYGEAPADIADPVQAAISQIGASVLDMAGVIGIGADALDAFTYQMKLSTKGMSEEQAAKAIQDELGKVNDAMAELALGAEGLAVALDGETAGQTLERLSASLVAVNSAFDTLGYSLYSISISGAAAAAELAGLFGSLDQFATATQTYYQAFYGEQERTSILTRQLTDRLRELGFSMPSTRDGFRALVEAQDLATASGRETYAALVSLAGQFDAILPAIGAMEERLGALGVALVGQASDAITRQIQASQSAAQQARQSASEFFRLADSLRAAESQIGSVSTASTFAQAQREFAVLAAQARTGDIKALGALGSAGASLARNAGENAGTQTELLRIEAGIRQQLSEGALVSEILGLGADYQAKLFDAQTAALEHLRDQLQQGNVTQEMLAEQIGLLESIGRAISDSAHLQVTSGREGSGKIVAGLVDNGGRVVAGLSDAAAQQIGAIAGQTRSLASATTGQTVAITGAQGLTTGQVTQVAQLQGETISLTDLVARFTSGSETLTRALLDRLSAGIRVDSIQSLVSGSNVIASLLRQLLAAQQAALAAQQAEAAARQAELARQSAIDRAQQELRAAVSQQKVVIGEVNAASQEIFDLAKKYGVFLNAKAGPVELKQTATFGVGSSGLFEAQYNQISGKASKFAPFKNEFYADGGLYDQTYGRAGELKALVEQIAAQRKAIIDLGGVPAFALGGMHSGGLAMVGEAGPELVNMGPSRVWTAEQTRQMLSGAAKSDPGRAESADLRAALFEIAKHTKRTADKLREWDGVGLPTERIE